MERLGHDCTVAEDGTEAWRRYRDGLPDVVITDWQMPGMDGAALTKAIRSHAGSAYAYVVVLTGAADETAARVTMEAGADDLLVKPLDIAQLERKLIAAARVTALHRRLHDDARHDPLTGLGNRLRLAEDLDVLRGRVARYGHVYSVALFDVDDFKGYNDRAGHVAGDDVLRAVGRALERQIRSGDALTEPGCRPDQLFELADKALYRAKQAGRNRVEAHRGDDAPEERATRRRPDVVVLDFDMPGGGGGAAAMASARPGPPRASWP